MFLHGTQFSNVWGSSGSANFDNSGWWYWRLLRLVPGYTRRGLGFVTKTTTLEKRDGNLPLLTDGKTPRETFPRCIKAFPFSGHVLNAVGLSGPGAPAVLNMLQDNPPSDPFMVSFMCVSEDHFAEARAMVKLLVNFKRHMPQAWALQVNFACPNSGEDLAIFFEELEELLSIFGELGVPVFTNFNPLVAVEAVLKADRHPACSGHFINNTVPWGSTPRINWQKFSAWRRRGVSPLTARGLAQPGGLSGPDCLSLVVDKVREARAYGASKPIIAGNGVQHPADVIRLYQADASGVALGVVGMMRPWRMRGIIKEAERRFG